MYIHQPVHRLSPQGTCVLHTHMPYATALCMLQNPRLEMAVQTALGFYGDIAYDSTYNGLAYDVSEGERLAQVLGEKSVLMMGNHGVLVVGKTMPQAFERLYFLERAAQAQVLALSTGRPLRLIPGTDDQEDRGAVRRGRHRRRPRSRGTALRGLEARSRPQQFGLRELNSRLPAAIDPARAARSPIVITDGGTAVHQLRRSRHFVHRGASDPGRSGLELHADGYICCLLFHGRMPGRKFRSAGWRSAMARIGYLRPASLYGRRPPS